MFYSRAFLHHQSGMKEGLREIGTVRAVLVVFTVIYVILRRSFLVQEASMLVDYTNHDEIQQPVHRRLRKSEETLHRPFIV